ncbi:YggU family protein [Candidatus Woesearchaeota archaeon]|nr:YggU family protein [Candidatus Woesearchaeota archaeon]
MEIQESRFKVIIRPNSPKNSIVGYDGGRKAYLVSIREKAEDNKANRELVKFLSRELKRRVRIKSGFSSREKLIETFINE